MVFVDMGFEELNRKPELVHSACLAPRNGSAAIVVGEGSVCVEVLLVQLLASVPVLGEAEYE
jgi:hypothetical protein